MTISILLPADRRHYGVLDFGEHKFRCLGEADYTAACAHGNEHRDPLKPFGHTPLGRWRAVLGGHWGITPGPLRSYGPHRVIELHPIDGEALQAQRNGRSGEAIHGGDLAADGGLRPTHGCVRLSNDDQAALVAAMEAAGIAACECEISAMAE